jgi:hypothetical protein
MRDTLGRLARERVVTRVRSVHTRGTRDVPAIAMVVVLLCISLAMGGCGNDSRARLKKLESSWIISPMPGTPYHSPVVGSWRSERLADVVVTFFPDGVATTTITHEGSLESLHKGNYVISGKTITIRYTYVSRAASGGDVETYKTTETYKYDGATIDSVNGNGIFTRVTTESETPSP